MTLSNLLVLISVCYFTERSYCGPLSQVVTKTEAEPGEPWNVAIHSRSTQGSVSNTENSGYCSIPLGIARDSINIQVGFTVSSPEGEPGDSSLNSEAAWSPVNLHDRTYIQVEFQTQMLISGIITQGSPTSTSRVTHFKILHSADCAHFTTIMDRHNTPKVFASNLEPNTTTTTMFLHVFHALCVRVVPTRRIGDETAMRFELLGCQSATCNTVLVPRRVRQDLYWKMLEFDAEKIVTSLKIVVNSETTVSPPMFFVVYSRTCNFDGLAAEIIRQNGEPVIFTPEAGSNEIVVNDTHMPIRAQCVSVYIPDPDRVETRAGNIRHDGVHERAPVVDFTVETEGCDALEHHGSVSSCGRTRLHGTATGSGRHSSVDGTNISSSSSNSSRRRQKRVVRGDPVTPGEYPWLVSLHFLGRHSFTDHSGLRHLCGASLISEQWVLTAAHCFHESLGEGLTDKENWIVVLGEHHQESQDGTEQFITIDKIISHPDFVLEEDTEILNDIALVKLSWPAVLSDYVNTICLEPNYTAPDHSACTTAGWGYIKVENGVGVELPHYAEVNIMPQQTCAERYSLLPDDHEAKAYVAINDSVLCATDEEHGSDSCWGDSGGPLFCYHDDHWSQAGIVSFGYNCGDARFPAIYTKVNYFYNWLQAVIANNTGSSS